MRVPPLSELRAGNATLVAAIGLDLAWFWDLLDSVGLTDADLPDDIPDDALMEWPEDGNEASQLAWWTKYFPAAVAKLEGELES